MEYTEKAGFYAVLRSDLEFEVTDYESVIPAILTKACLSRFREKYRYLQIKDLNITTINILEWSLRLDYVSPNEFDPHQVNGLQVSLVIDMFKPIPHTKNTIVDFDSIMKKQKYKGTIQMCQLEVEFYLFSKYQKTLAGCLTSHYQMIEIGLGLGIDRDEMVVVGEDEMITDMNMDDGKEGIKEL